MNKKLKITITSLIALALIGGGVYGGYYLKNNLDKSSDSNDKSTISEVSDGKIFTNNQYGYSVKFPKSWYLYDEDLMNVRIQLEQDQPKDTPQDQILVPGPGATALGISVIHITDQSKSLEDLVKDYYKTVSSQMSSWQSETPELQKVRLGNQEAIKAQIKDCDGVGCGPEWFLKNGDYLYHIISPTLGYNSNLEYNQIVESFKFTKITEPAADSSANPADTVTNEL